VATAFLQYYREHASFKERTYDFVPRIGLEELQAQVLDEAEQVALLERFRLAKTAAAARDPWLERRAPYHQRQFTDLDSVVLPQAGANGANGHGPDPAKAAGDEADSPGEARELELVGPPPEGER
jgi:nitrite reductase (NADH) large subunit